jgi:hypothetical protein
VAGLRSSGHGRRFRVEKGFIDRYELYKVGGPQHLEYWITAEDLGEFTVTLSGQSSFSPNSIDLGERPSGWCPDGLGDPLFMERKRALASSSTL